MKIRLTGNMAAKYDIYYRVHAERIGWMNWAKNGAEAGTQGFGYEVEAYQVQLVPKGEVGPTGSDRSFLQYQDIKIQYQASIPSKGWGKTVSPGTYVGTVGQALPIEALRINLVNNPLVLSGALEYRMHVSNIGWQGWSKNNAITGTLNRNLQGEAVQIRLTGELALHYDIYYRVHSSDYGWLGWTKNGNSAGTEGKIKEMEAVEIMVTKKYGLAPSPQSNAFIK